MGAEWFSSPFRPALDQIQPKTTEAKQRKTLVLPEVRRLWTQSSVYWTKRFQVSVNCY